MASRDTQEWTSSYNGRDAFNIWSNPGVRVAIVETEQDAVLIAAAPKMRKALELVAENTPLDNCSPFIAAVMDALESAKGV